MLYFSTMFFIGGLFIFFIFFHFENFTRTILITLFAYVLPAQICIIPLSLAASFSILGQRNKPLSKTQSNQAELFAQEVITVIKHPEEEITDSEITETIQFYQNVAKEIKTQTKPVIRITAIKSDKLDLFKSKFFGIPYFPQNQTYPLDSHGNPLAFIAQLNLQEIPENKLLSRTGILQFFVANTVDNGLSDPKKGFKVIYHPEIISDPTQLMSDFSFVTKHENWLPAQEQFQLKFKVAKEIMTFQDHNFLKMVTPTRMKKVAYRYEEIIAALGIKPAEPTHKIGGFPDFIQFDPREKTTADYILLFQMNSQNNIDTENAGEIMWGDGGIANFFIAPADLKNLNFTNVLYHWDCY